MHEDIAFLKELQQELKTQDTDCQAAPRFWVVGDYEMVSCAEGEHEEYHVISCGCDCQSIELNELLKGIETDTLEGLSREAQEEFADIGCEVSAVEWINKHYDGDAYLVPVKERHFIRQNTMFLTKAEAKNHIKVNSHHYSSRAHTYAMTAWRAPKVERLLKILELFDWDKLAAAPELLEACRVAIRLLNEVDLPLYRRPDYLKIRHAISKTEGRVPDAT